MSANISVAKLLELPTLAHASVVAGASGINNPVRNVGVVAGSEITQWVKPHAMLLSSGHPLSEASADLPRIVEDLAARNVACLAVRPGAYDFEFSREMRAAADDRGLPLVSLADEFAFDDILIDVLGTINLALRREVDFVENIHTATTEMLIEGASLDGLSQKVSEFLGAEVAVFDPRGQRVAAWPPNGDTPAWEDLEATAAVLGAVGWPTRTIRLRLGTDAAPLGYLHIHRDDLAFGPTEVQAAEKVSNVVTLALAQRSAIRSVEVNFEREVVARVLRGEIEDPGEVTQRLASVGWDHPGPVVVAVVRVTTLGEAPGANTEDVSAWLQIFGASMARDVPGHGSTKTTAAVVGSDMVLATSAGNADALGAICQRLASSYQRRAGRDPRVELAVGQSAPLRGAGHLRLGYRQAEIALRAGLYRGRAQHLTRFEDLGTLGVVLAAVTDPAHADLFPNDLARMEQLPDHERRELIDTLRVVLSTNLNLAQSARQLHCHYNTVRRRVQRLEDLLGPFTTDADAHLAVNLALRLFDFRRGESAGASRGGHMPTT